AAGLHAGAAATLHDGSVAGVEHGRRAALRARPGRQIGARAVAAGAGAEQHDEEREGEIACGLAHDWTPTLPWRGCSSNTSSTSVASPQLQLNSIARARPSCSTRRALFLPQACAPLLLRTRLGGSRPSSTTRWRLMMAAGCFGSSLMLPPGV